jgi:carotenoid 1,2-hydratase
VSEDGKNAIVVIALLGNPFSPAYAAAYGRGVSEPLSFCALNVAVYGSGASAWCLTERALRQTDRSALSVTFGASTMHWAGDDLVVEIAERTAPLGRPVRGQVVLRPAVRPGVGLTLDGLGRHRWWPVAPIARIDVNLASPALRFSGHAYHDANAGAEPLAAAFDSWHWARAQAPSGAMISYDVTEASGASRSLALQITRQGVLEHLEGLRTVVLPRTLWGIRRHTRADPGEAPRVVRELENGPFYSRSLVATRLVRNPLLAVQESLAAHRLRRAWVHRLARFRMRHDG